jgi:DNA-binding NtrC family response regulator
MISAHGDVELAKQTIEMGAFDYTIFPPSAHESVGRDLEQAALTAMQRGAGGEKHDVIRALDQIRTMLRFAKDLGDIGDDDHRRLEASVAKARRPVGLS